MNTDFIIPTVAKSGTSIKLKSKNVRDVRLENIQLEVQNREMEEKLNQLRESMAREKEERERANAYHWKSGQTVRQNQDKENILKV
ncbi:hypothetical protein GDO86_010116 [Hymenochirus boettgeri]|uniref:ZBBX protein n=1 Tax=Hymenochirus boettgeri TaxID=247094 RepID=A0A8T2JNT6_9PIPI|nr:hypothetical protein GDO86_010116 [Hymenochirus boettgeri]